MRIQKGDSSELKDYPMEEVQRPGAANARREEPVEAPVVEAAVAPAEDKSAEEQPREERKPRKEERRPKPVEQDVKAEKPEAKSVDNPAEPVKAVEAEQKPAANSWKAALERAMKEAEGAGK